MFFHLSTPSAPFRAGVGMVRAVATSACFLQFGQTPTASATGHYLRAGAVEYFRVENAERVAATRVDADSILYLSEMM